MRAFTAVVLLLAACDTDTLESSTLADTASVDSALALPGEVLPPPAFTLAATPLIPGQLFSLQATGVTPGAQVVFLRGFAAGVNCPPQLGGECLGLAAPQVLGTAVASPGGSAVLVITPPLNAPVGLTMRFQAAVAQPAGVSNLLTLTTRSECGDALMQQGETCDDGNAVAGDGCSATCQVEVALDTFRVNVVSCLVTANAPGGGQWDSFAIIPPFTDPDLFVQFTLNNVVVGRTATVDDSIRPTWNASAVLDVFPGESVELAVFDEEPIGMLNDLVRTFTLRRADLDAMRNAGPQDLSGGAVRRLTIEITDP